MRTLFNLDGPFFSGLSRLTDLVILNLLFLVLCIPIVTIGAAMSALSYVLLKMKDGEEGYVTRTFFRGFRQNFKQATLVWLIMLAAGGILWVDLNMALTMGSAYRWMRIAVYVGIVLWLMITCYVFPLIARFVNTTRAMLRNAVLLSLANAPKTMLMLALIVGSYLATIATQNTFIWGLLVWLLIGFSLLGWINITLLYKVFEQLMPHEEAPSEDGWTLPDEEGDSPK